MIGCGCVSSDNRDLFEKCTGQMRDTKELLFNDDSVNVALVSIINIPA